MEIIDSLVNPITNPSIIIGSFEWREPITTLTDMLVSLISFYAFFIFVRYKGQKSTGYNYFKAFFILFGIGMMASAWFGHGLKAYFDPSWKVIGWAVNSFANLLLGIAVLKEIEPITKPFWNKSLKIFFIAQVSVLLFLMINPSTSHFLFTQLCSVISLLLLILPMQIFNYSKTKAKGSLFFIIAIAMGLLPALFFNAQISISRWFNYHDISHVFMSSIVFIMFLGASRLSFKEKYN